MWAHRDQSLKQHASDQFLNGFLIRFRKQIQQRAAEVMRMTVRISQLIDDRVEKQITSFVVQRHRQILKNVHVRRVRDRRHAGPLIVRLDRFDRLIADVQNDRVHQLHIIFVARVARRLQFASQIAQKLDGGSALQIIVQIVFETFRRQSFGNVDAQYARWIIDLAQLIDLQIRHKWIRQAHVPRIRGQNQIAQLDAIRLDRIAQQVMVVAEQLREIVQ